MSIGRPTKLSNVCPMHPFSGRKSQRRNSTQKTGNPTKRRGTPGMEQRERSGWQPHLASCRKTGAGSGFSLISLFLTPLLSSQFTRKSDCNTSESIQSLTTFHFSCEHPGPSHHPDHCGLLAGLSASFLVLFLTEQLAWCDPFQVQVPWIGVICCDIDGPRVCHTEWSKSEREKQALYIHTSTWNPEKWYRGTYLQGGNRDSDIENPHVDVVRGSGGWDALGEGYTTLRKTDC